MNFLDNFYDIHDKCIQVYPNKRLIVYQEDVETRIGKAWMHSPSMKGKFIQKNIKRKLYWID